VALPVKAFPLTLIKNEISPRLPTWRVAGSAMTSTNSSLDPGALRHPDSHAITVAGTGFSRVGISLAYRPIGMKRDNVVRPSCLEHGNFGFTGHSSRSTVHRLL
jgi:hypothetical protein